MPIIKVGFLITHALRTLCTLLSSLPLPLQLFAIAWLFFFFNCLCSFAFSRISSKFSSMLFSESLIGLHFAFRSMIHFELIFVKSLRFVSRFIFMACGCPVVPVPAVQ